MGEPKPFCTAHHPSAIMGGEPGRILIVLRSPPQAAPPALKATYVPWAVVYAAVPPMIRPLDTWRMSSGAERPPSALRLSRYAFWSLPSATTILDGFDPGMSRRIGD